MRSTGITLRAQDWQLSAGMSPSLPFLTDTICLRVPGSRCWPGAEYCWWGVSPHWLEQGTRMPSAEELWGRALPSCSLHDMILLVSRSSFRLLIWFVVFYSHFPCLVSGTDHSSALSLCQVTWITTFCSLLASLLLCKIISKPDISIVKSDIFVCLDFAKPIFWVKISHLFFIGSHLLNLVKFWYFWIEIK